MNSVVASLDSVHFTYDGVRPVLHGVSLQLCRGGMYAFRGPNGAGKSTLVSIFIGMLEPTRGQATVGGSSAPAIRSARSACVHQHLLLFAHLTVADNLVLGMEAGRFRSFVRSASGRAAAKEHLDRLGLDIPLDAICGDLRYPEQQQLAIARALLRMPDVLFLDEPTSVLDEPARATLFRLLQRLNAGGMTIVLVTHDPGDTRAIGAKEIYVRDGRLEEPSVDESTSVDAVRALPGERATNDDWNDDEVYEADTIPSTIVPRTRWTFPARRTQVLCFDDAMQRTEYVSSIADGAVDVLSGGRSHRRRGCTDTMRVLTISRQQEALFPSLSVLDNSVLLAGRRATGLRDRSEEMALVARLKSAAAIVWPGHTAAVSTLSGGNQQRLLLSCVVEARPAILVAEEPLMGVDEASRECIIGLLREHLDRNGRLIIATCFVEDYRAYEQSLRIRFSELAGSATQ